MSTAQSQFGGNRGTKFVFYKDLRTGRTDEMNWWEWEIRMSRPEERKNFELIRVVDLGERPVVRTDEVPVPQVEEDPLQCPLCGMVAKNENGLKLHKVKKHG